jgi:hypothetical protein
MKEQGEVIVEGVKGMLDDQAIGGDELTVAKLKEEFYNLLLKKIKSMLPSRQLLEELLHSTSSGANFSWSNARLIPSGAKRLQARSLTAHALSSMAILPPG